jgi:hypothetical protein
MAAAANPWVIQRRERERMSGLARVNRAAGDVNILAAFGLARGSGDGAGETARDACVCILAR